MQAIEFVTKKQGKMIEIPQEYINEITGEFRVIVLIDKKVTKTKGKKTFKAFEVDTKGYKFNRDDAYDE